MQTGRVPMAGAAAVAAALILVGCGSTGGTANPSAASEVPSKSPSVSASGSAPVEVNPPGDIPDNQAFVPYAGTGFTTSIPEGWARSTQGAAVVFSDKYNSVTITEAAAAQAPTTASVQAQDVPAIKAASQGFKLGPVSTVQRKAGQAVLINYHALSPVNQVTGKVANEAIERYVFWKAGRSVTLTLAAPDGADNVDPWRTVTDAFAWTT